MPWQWPGFLPFGLGELESCFPPRQSKAQFSHWHWQATVTVAVLLAAARYPRLATESLGPAPALQGGHCCNLKPGDLEFQALSQGLSLGCLPRNRVRQVPEPQWQLERPIIKDSAAHYRDSDNGGRQAAGPHRGWQPEVRDSEQGLPFKFTPTRSHACGPTRTLTRSCRVGLPGSR